MDQKFEAILGEWFIKQASNYVDNEIRQFEVGWSRQGDLIRVYLHCACIINNTNDLLLYFTVNFCPLIF